MKRKEFLKTSSSLVVAGGCLSSMISCGQPVNVVRKNWAGNYQYTAEHLHEPKSVDELRALVKKLDSQKALGSMHCFNNIADSRGNQVSTRYLNKVVSIDKLKKTVTVESGIRYGELAPVLNEEGLALHNLASLPHISVAGACATATHGSGVGNGNLSSAVSSLEMVTAAGELVVLAKGDPDFNGSVVNLGALGIVARLTLDVRDTFTIRQYVFQNMPLHSLVANFDSVLSAGYSVSLFTDWQDEKISQVWVKKRMDEEAALPDDFFGATPANRNLHPITELSAENCSAQMGVEGPWYEHLPHFKMGFTPSSGEELQSEYFVPRENAVEALLALEKMKDRIYPHLFISEIRTIGADDLWLSPSYRRDCAAFHFTWKPEWEEVSKLLPDIERELSAFGVLPHWGKLFAIAPGELHSRYERMDDFIALARKYDPAGKFTNDFLRRNLFRTT